MRSVMLYTKVLAAPITAVQLQQALKTAPS